MARPRSDLDLAASDLALAASDLSTGCRRHSGSIPASTRGPFVDAPPTISNFLSQIRVRAYPAVVTISYLQGRAVPCAPEGSPCAVLCRCAAVRRVGDGVCSSATCGEALHPVADNRSVRRTPHFRCQ